MQKFSDYLKKHKDLSSPEGDLARDFIKSKSKATTYKGILKHLENNNADFLAFEVLNSIKMKYDKQEK